MKGLFLLELFVAGVALWMIAPSAARRKAALRWAGTALVVACFLLGKCWITVPAATVAALYDPFAGGIQSYDLGEGWHLVAPWVEVKYFSVRTQTYTMSSLEHEGKGGGEDAILSQTKEGLALSIDATILFHITAGDANKLWRAVGPNYVDVIVRPNVREAVRTVVSQYPVMSVYSNAPESAEGTAGIDFFPGKRQEVSDEVVKRLAGPLKEKGVTLERFLLRNVDYVNPEFEASIVQKQVAQQNIVTQQYEAEIQRVRGQANIVRAEGDAEAIRLKAAALRVQPKVVQWEMIQKLPNDLDVVILPDRSMPMVDLREYAAATPAPAQPAQPQAPPQPQQQAAP
jgi:regulator of protease activity HflC (stomatin/prohibitin superfamily)